jgi:hypothetical protein
MPGSDERRRHRRFALRLPATLSLSGGAAGGPAHLADLSEGGAFLTCRAALPVDAGVYVRFRIDGETVCEATGSVLRVMPFGAEQGVAVAFVYANEALLAFLRALHAALDADRPELLADIRGLEIQVA